jgi:oligopeptide/dipeptide ABC transporter ATP-binding protein
VSSEPVVSVKNLETTFMTKLGPFKAVNNVSFDIHRGKTLGIVGESGCGKSVTSFSMMRLIDAPGKITQGQVIMGNRDLMKISEEEMEKVRGQKMAIIFQEPMTALNPYLKIGTQIIEPYLIHQKATKLEAKKKALETLEKVWIANPEKIFNSYPHELSGGMRQRIVIAMAIMNEPEILIADEPTTALDVTVQAQILELFKKIQKENKMSIIFITHDLGVLASIADRVAVMYAGKIYEQADAMTLFAKPQHPYTYGLLKSTPRIDEKSDTLYSIAGLPPNLYSLKTGCSFFGRCQYRLPECENIFPPNKSTVKDQENFCHLERFEP